MTDAEVSQYQQQHPGKDPYIAHPGDTVESIAAEHNVPEAELRALNGAGPGDKVHAGQIVALPSGSLRTANKNGYHYSIDSADRTHKAEGDLYLAEVPERSKANQRAAGSTDRLATDDGGHFIAARFGGPTESFNHFAQDASFNRGGYRALEDKWAREVRSGDAVHVAITAHYPGASRRPDSLTVRWSVNGHSNIRSFSNTSKGKSHGR